MKQPVILLCGGTSSERRVSVATAQNLLRVLPQAQLAFIAPDGAVFTPAAAALAAHADPFATDFVPPGEPRWPDLAALAAALPSGPVFFLALHGGDGENGVVQACLARAGHAFTASDAAASALCFDKERTKQQVAQAGLHCAAASLLPVGLGHRLEDLLQQLFAARGPLVLKPVADGSSVGVLFCRAASDVAPLAAAVAAAGRPYLAEDLVVGREITVGVVDAPAAAPCALPPTEVVLEQGRAFDFAGKYLGQGSQELTPAPLTPALTAAAQQVALTAHRILGCAGYSRTDMILAEAGFIFLELNTLPGLTRASFLPQQLAAAQRSFADFVSQQVALGARRATGAGLSDASCASVRGP